jgi:RecA-family ATPase
MECCRHKHPDFYVEQVAMLSPEEIDQLIKTAKDRHSEKGNGTGVETQPPAISASPFVWRDPATIPPRAWLYGKHYIRKFLTCTVGLGGGGKTSELVVEALAMATGRPLLGITPAERARVWIWNGEDPVEELDRRIVAAMIKHDIKPEDIEGYLFRDTGRQTPLVVGSQSRNGTVVARPVVDAIIAEIKRKQIDALIVDPFIKSHKVAENDNNAIDQVASEWAAIADICNCAVELSHHSRKTGGAEVTIEDMRGAVALVNASRSVRVLNKMTKDEAKNAFLEEATAWRYYRIDNGKANMAPPPENAQWYKLETVRLANGDEVGAATAWT